MAGKPVGHPETLASLEHGIRKAVNNWWEERKQRKFLRELKAKLMGSDPYDDDYNYDRHRYSKPVVVYDYTTGKFKRKPRATTCSRMVALVSRLEQENEQDNQQHRETSAEKMVVEKGVPGQPEAQ
jgi:hypothetical protein